MSSRDEVIDGHPAHLEEAGRRRHGEDGAVAQQVLGEVCAQALVDLPPEVAAVHECRALGDHAVELERVGDVPVFVAVQVAKPQDVTVLGLHHAVQDIGQYLRQCAEL